MPRPRNTVPAYLSHASGRARVRTYTTAGKRIEIILPGQFGSQESLEAYAELLKRIRAGGGAIVPESTPDNIAVGELVEKYLREHVETHHRAPDGAATSEAASIITALKPFVRLFADKPARNVNPLDLRAYRDVIINGSWRTLDEEKKRQRTGKKGPLSRRTVNAHVGRVKRMFRWAASLCIVPPHVLTALSSLPGLQPGRSKARDLPPVEAVSIGDVDKTIQHAPEIIADMIRLQLFSGCRAGELCNACTADIHTDGPNGCWTLTPPKHKGAWRGHKRVIVFGPKCQLILRRYLTPTDPERKLFRPCDTAYAKARPKGKFGQRYSVSTYDIGIKRAAKRAKVNHWSSHQLRHLAARIAEREIGLEAARQLLGHRGADLTAMYAGLDTEGAARVAQAIG